MQLGGQSDFPLLNQPQVPFGVSRRLLDQSFQSSPGALTISDSTSQLISPLALYRDSQGLPSNPALSAPLSQVQGDMAGLLTGRPTDHTADAAVNLARGLINQRNVPNANDGWDALQSANTAKDRVMSGLKDLRALRAGNEVIQKVETVAPEVSTFGKVKGFVTRNLPLGFSLLGIWGGGSTLIGGFKELANAQDGLEKAEGVCTITQGTSSTLGSLGQFMNVTKFASVGSKFLSGTAGVACLADGLHDLFQGIHDGNTDKIVGGSVETLGGGLMTASLVCPVLFPIGAAIYGIGKVWEHRKDIAKFAVNTWHKVEHIAGEVKDFVSGAVHGVEKAASSVGNAIKKAWNWLTG
jgi:hypothetical protein